MELVSSAENSTLDWKAQYRYVEDIGDGRGYTAGMIGFCSGTGDMLDLVSTYTVARRATGCRCSCRRCAASTARILIAGWDTLRRRMACGRERPGVPACCRTRSATGCTSIRLSPPPGGRPRHARSVRLLRRDGHARSGQDTGASAASARRRSPAGRPPSAGGDEARYLDTFLDVRTAVMKVEEAHSDTSRIDDAQRVFLRERNFGLTPPLRWRVYGDSYAITD